MNLVSTMRFEETSPAEVNALLLGRHYLGPFRQERRGVVAFVGLDHGVAVAGQIWKRPTARHLPSDGSWLELARWVLTPAAGINAGSRMHRYVLRWIRKNLPKVTTLVSYSDPSVGHTGALYKACGWEWAPTWHRLKPPPTGAGSWDGITKQEPKDRWIFRLARGRPLESEGPTLQVGSEGAAMRPGRSALRTDGQRG